jgi:peptidoglycan/LPS O-acetylase OafA/YrhL
MELSAQLNSAQKAYLDFLRALAAQLVLFGHVANYFLPDTFFAHTGGMFQSVGVNIFFLISGFLISYSVFMKRSDPSYRFGSYMADRFSRIYSAYLPALVLVAIVDALIVNNPAYRWKHDYNVQTWLGNLLMLQDFPLFQALRRLGVEDHSWFVAEFGSARPFWTISIEWWIYLLFGGVMFLVCRPADSRPRRLGVAALLFLAISAIEPAYHFVGGFGRCLSMLWGIGLGASWLQVKLPLLQKRDRPLSPTRLFRISVAVAVAGVVFMLARLLGNHFETRELQFSLFLALSVFGVLFALAFAKPRVPRAVGWGTGFVAAYSYSLYLTHHTFLEYASVKRPGLVGHPGSFWLMVAAANILAIAFWFLFERHYRQLARLAKIYLRKAKSTPTRLLAGG